MNEKPFHLSMGLDEALTRLVRVPKKNAGKSLKNQGTMKKAGTKKPRPASRKTS